MPLQRFCLKPFRPIPLCFIRNKRLCRMYMFFSLLKGGGGGLREKRNNFVFFAIINFEMIPNITWTFNLFPLPATLMVFSHQSQTTTRQRQDNKTNVEPVQSLSCSGVKTPLHLQLLDPPPTSPGYAPE